MAVKRVWFENDRIYIETDDERVLWQLMLYYQRLMNATDEQRTNYELGAFGIHWEDIDEDVSYESFEYDNPEPVGIKKPSEERERMILDTIREIGWELSAVSF